MTCRRMSPERADHIESVCDCLYVLEAMREVRAAWAERDRARELLRSTEEISEHRRQRIDAIHECLKRVEDWQMKHPGPDLPDPDRPAADRGSSGGGPAGAGGAVEASAEGK